MSGRNRKERKAHLKKRMKQRYGIEMTKADRAAIKQSIKDEDVIFVEQRTPDSKVYDVPFKNIGHMIRVVYNETLDQIVTVLPPLEHMTVFRVEYVDRKTNEVAFAEISSDSKMWASQKVMCLHNPKEIKSVTPLRAETRQDQ